MKGNTMLTKRFRFGAGACLAMACLLTLAVDASAACRLFTAKATDGNRVNARAQVIDELAVYSRKRRCGTATIKCRRANYSWRCEGLQNCCGGTIGNKPKPHLRICNNLKSGPAVNRNIRRARARAIYVARAKGLKFLNRYKVASCQRVTVRCETRSNTPNPPSICSATQRCCRK